MPFPLAGPPRRDATQRVTIQLALALVTAVGASGCGSRAPLYRDPSAPIEDRVNDLLHRMTPEEKFWQLFAVAADIDPTRDSLQHGIFGVQWRAVGADSLHPSAAQFARHINELQHYFVEHTRLGIPFIPFEEALHGLTQPDATVFPQAIGLAATWDTALMAQVATTIARETRSRGIRQVLSPVINLATDVRWGRTEESYGEDPLLSSAMGVAFVAPFERAGVITTPKHFVANVGDGGRDSWPINVSHRYMQETTLVPFDAVIHAGGARSIMAAYNSVDGEPASASRWLLTDLLRTRWGFRGFVISDAGGVGGANVLHNTAHDYAEAGARAVQAGLDVIFQTSVHHATLFMPAFLDGRIPAGAIDAAVARVLRAKFELGLFDHPYIVLDSASVGGRSAAASALSEDAARAALTLLRNRDQSLPFSPATKRIAVIGSDAVDARQGGYSGPGSHRVTILEGIRASLPERGVVTYAPGVPRLDATWSIVSDSAFPSGLQAEYFGNITLAGSPSLQRLEQQVDHAWPFSAPDSVLTFGWYSARWRGELVVPEGPPLELAIAGNDGYRLYLDDRLVVDRWSKISYHRDVAAGPMQPGSRHQVRLEYFENSGAGQIHLFWKHARDAEWRGAIAKAVSTARGSDVAVVVAGIEEGEYRDRSSLRLPGHQEELITAVAATGRPVVVVLVAGSAVTMSSWIDQVGAVLLAWYPGERGGKAVADALFGRSNPAGRLPISFPLNEGQLPMSYWHLPTGRGDDYQDLTGRPLFPFGFGLSYSQFSYSDISLAGGNPRSGDSVEVRFQVTNTGPYDGDEVPQVYLRQLVASSARSGSCSRPHVSRRPIGHRDR